MPVSAYLSVNFDTNGRTEFIRKSAGIGETICCHGIWRMSGDSLMIDWEDNPGFETDVFVMYDLTDSTIAWMTDYSPGYVRSDSFERFDEQ